MARKLAVKKMDNGEIGITCPRCEEEVVPVEVSIFDGYECPDCFQAIHKSALANYREALKAKRDQDERDEYGEY